MLHIFLHFLIPAVVTLAFFRKDWKKAYLILVLTMLVDVDHLLADPIYDPNRCSIGFHPFHQLGMIVLYVLFCFFPGTRLVGIGLTIHMALDSLDCQFTNGIWSS